MLSFENQVVQEHDSHPASPHSESTKRVKSGLKHGWEGNSPTTHPQTPVYANALNGMRSIPPKTQTGTLAARSVDKT